MKLSCIAKIKVLDRYVKQIVINSLNWNAPGIRPSAAPPVTKANVWVEIVQCDSGKNYPFLPIGTFDAPVIYKSPIRSNVDTTTTPLLFDVPGDIRLDVTILNHLFGYQGFGYGFNLYEQDASGTYIVCSNFWSGFGITYGGGGIPTNTLTLSTQILGNRLTLVCNYK